MSAGGWQEASPSIPDAAPEVSGTQDEGPAAKKPKTERQLVIAVVGCSHGEMDLIYSSLQAQERYRNVKIDLVICCGDFEAIRNGSDMQSMSVPPKYAHMGTFHRYYSGEVTAPYLTIFVGGNHESAAYLAELPHGGWVAPNIYYMGFASVIRVAGMRIAGLSGIYSKYDYDKNHYERPPFAKINVVKSFYHVRSQDIYRLKHLSDIDIMVTHDWPQGITDYGNVEQLLRFKPHFREDIANGELGSPPSTELLQTVKPRNWFAAHMHCRFEATVNHGEGTTKFLALGKPIRNKKTQFYDILTFPRKDDAPLKLSYDREWLAILKSTQSLTQTSFTTVYLPTRSSSDPSNIHPTSEELAEVDEIFEGKFDIPLDFQMTAPPHGATGQGNRYDPCYYYLNPQTTKFCEKLGIRNLNALLYNSRDQGNGRPYYEILERLTDQNPEAIDLGDDDGDDDDLFIDDAAPEAGDNNAEEAKTADSEA